MRIEIIENCVLYCGDSLEIMHSIDKSDCIVTDPPYRLTSGGCTKNGGLHERMGGGDYKNDGQIVECNIDWTDFMPIMYDCLERGHAYIMCNNRHISNCENAALNTGFKLHNWLVWDKITATPNRWYMKNCEFTGLFYKGKAQEINDCSAKQLTKCPQIDESKHPTEKPVALMRHYIENSTKRGQLVLDPFMGSGTTGVACVEAGRKFIGIEKDENFFEIACERIKAAYDSKQGDLF